MASIAANFRSTCDSERGAPEFSTQRSRTAAPHVGQGTEDICLGVSSLFFTLVECAHTQSRICTILHTAAQLVIRGQMNFGHCLSGRRSRVAQPRQHAAALGCDTLPRWLMSDLKMHSRQALVQEVNELHERLDRLETMIRSLDGKDPKKAELEILHNEIAKNAPIMKQIVAAWS